LVAFWRAYRDRISVARLHQVQATTTGSGTAVTTVSEIGAIAMRADVIGKMSVGGLIGGYLATIGMRVGGANAAWTGTAVDHPLTFCCPVT
jgi:hypothetical protein